ncbi:unnamed protein product [Brachionus calyciflorus]|uniref:Uncharacterized protein n=1 Tax=Brachionus calyciflorus TaxID=104777 RepID=A0A813RLF6_9BILA|nr:unnamed protein product [Brachionus calyciflorus]
MNKYLFCFFVALISVSYLKGQDQLICKKCPDNTVMDWKRCVVPVSDGQPCSPNAYSCKNSNYKCIRKTVSSSFTCDKCKDNQFITLFHQVCLDKIKDGELCENSFEECLNPDFSCLEDSHGDYRCGKCAKNQFLDETRDKCINKIKDGQICSSNLNKCENPGFTCLKLDNNNDDLRCGKCKATQNIDKSSNRCVDKIRTDKNTFGDGQPCPNESSYCKSSGYRCLRKNNQDRKFYCLKCGLNQFIDLSEYICKNKVKDGGECSSSSDQCESQSYSCLKKKDTDTQYFCLKCTEDQYIDFDDVCNDKIADGKPCKKGWGICQTLGYYCLEK